MSDNHTPEIRSYNMSRIRSKDTAPEVLVRKFLFSHGFRYRKNVAALPGKPDIVMKKYKTVIFIQGCFWHMHLCERFKWPSSNEEYWKPKIEGNAMRDKEHKKQLENMGWSVIEVWECELKKDRFESTMENLVHDIVNGRADNS